MKRSPWDEARFLWLCKATEPAAEPEPELPWTWMMFLRRLPPRVVGSFQRLHRAMRPWWKARPINSFEELLANTPADLRGRGNFGVQSLQDVREALYAYGLKLKNDEWAPRPEER